jgi:diaminopimelate epimerase
VQVQFSKLHGAGNDFIVVDNFENPYNSWNLRFVRDLCTRCTGIGADGLLVIEKSDHAGFRMRFFNSDGQESEMCVNGSRCISLVAFNSGYISKNFTFEAGDGIHEGEIIAGNLVRIQVILRQNHKETRTFPVDFQLPGDIYFKRFLNTGVPHVVLQCDNVETVPVSRLGSDLRFHSYYQPEGTNVNFVESKGDRTELILRLRTFERGVDAETLSCGTGAAASVLTFNKKAQFDCPVKVQTRGGQLTVYADDTETNVYVEGPVKHVYHGTFSMEDIS